MAYAYGGLGSYGGCGSSYAQVPQGLAGYGQSLSSEQIDFNSLGLGGYPGYSAAPYGSAYANPYGAQYGAPYGAPAYPQPYGYGAQSYGAPNPYQGSVDLNDPQLQSQVEQIVASFAECRRPMLRRQVITVPANCPGRVTCITRRLPTPPPDIIERITVIKPPRDVVNLCIEKPCQPGPCFQQREICGRPRKPLIQPRVITVPPRSNPCAPPPPPPQPVCMPPPPQPCMAAPQPACASFAPQPAPQPVSYQQQPIYAQQPMAYPQQPQYAAGSSAFGGYPQGSSYFGNPYAGY